MQKYIESIEEIRKRFDESAYKKSPFQDKDSTAVVPLGNWYWLWTPQECWNFFLPYLHSRNAVIDEVLKIIYGMKFDDALDIAVTRIKALKTKEEGK